jgi:hypothetical protein
LPNWLFADLMTVPVRFTGVAAVDVALAAGVWASGCDSVPLLAGDVDPGALGTPVPLRTSSPQPTSTTPHMASAAMIRIRRDPFR